MGRTLLTIFLLIFSLASFGQRITPSAKFLKDSVAIGEEVAYSLWIHYPKERDVIFPDSLFDFSPFEINKRSYFTTRSDSTESLDSVVYFLSTFEIDTIQYLQLPVYLVNEFDSIDLLPTLDSIILKHVVTSIPDSVDVIVNTEFQKVPLAFNYPYLVAGLIILAIAGVIIFLAFGGRIKRMIKVYWINRRHNRFVASFTELINTDTIKVEKSLKVWRRYLEKLEGLPYSKLTTREIFEQLEEEDLLLNLGIIDRFIYSPHEKPDTSAAFVYLLDFAVERHHQRINQIKNG